MYKAGVEVISRKGLYYRVGDGGKPLTFTPWLGDALSFLYDFIMKRSIFPKKFGGDMARHHEILADALREIRGKRVLELATGSGSAVHFLASDNRYTGTDISPGLLKRARRNFGNAGFENAAFHVASADDLPFADGSFDTILCMLSLNFFVDAGNALQEVKRVAAPTGVFIGSVPVPERKKTSSKIRGTLYSENELAQLCREKGMDFESIDAENGALLYFRAFC